MTNFRVLKVATLAACLCVALLVGSRAGGVVVTQLRTHSVLLAPPSGAAVPNVASLHAVACPLTGGCWGVGDFQLPGELTQPMVVLRSLGHWGKASSIQLPSSAYPEGYASLSAVSCATATTCVAVGIYTLPPTGIRTGNQLPMVAFEVQGRWDRARAIVLPRNAARGSARTGYAGAVTCDPRARCTLVGNYTTAAGRGRSFRAAAVVVGSDAELSPGEALPFSELQSSLGAGPEGVSLGGLACSGPSRCTAVGSASVRNGSTSVPVVETEVRGTWALPVAAPLPPTVAPRTATAFLSGLACPTPARCVAVGGVQTAAGGARALVDVLAAGHWHWSTPPPVAQGLEQVSCAGDRYCVAVGVVVSTTPDMSFVSSESAVVATGSIAGLTAASVVRLPSGGPGSANRQVLQSVACVPSAKCTAVGSVEDVASHLIAYIHAVATTFSAR
jgi:hypothetical protein